MSKNISFGIYLRSGTRLSRSHRNTNRNIKKKKRREVSQQMSDQDSTAEGDPQQSTSGIVKSKEEAENKKPTASSNMSTFNLSHAIKLIPEYDGNPNTLHRFIQTAKIQHTRASSEDNKAELLDVIKSKLTGRAYNIILRYNDYTTWSDLQAALETQFSSERSPQLIQSEIFNLKQGFRESVLEYSEQAGRLLDELNISTTKDQTAEGSKAIRQLNEQTTISNFKRGLSHPLKLILKVVKHDTLRAAVEYAIEEEKQLNSERRPGASSPRRQCQYCKRLGHEANECRKVRDQFQTNKVNGPNHTYLFPKREPINAIVQNTPQKFCRYCKKSGHEISECRKRQYNNSRRNAVNNTHSENSLTPGQSGTTTRARDLN